MYVFQVRLQSVFKECAGDGFFWLADTCYVKNHVHILPKFYKLSKPI